MLIWADEVREDRAIYKVSEDGNQGLPDHRGCGVRSGRVFVFTADLELHSVERRRISMKLGCLISSVIAFVSLAQADPITVTLTGHSQEFSASSTVFEFPVWGTINISGLGSASYAGGLTALDQLRRQYLKRGVCGQRRCFGT